MIEFWIIIIKMKERICLYITNKYTRHDTTIKKKNYIYSLFLNTVQLNIHITI